MLTRAHAAAPHCGSHCRPRTATRPLLIALPPRTARLTRRTLSQAQECSEGNINCCRAHHNPLSRLCSQCDKDWAPDASGVCVPCQGAPTSSLLGFLGTFKPKELFKILGMATGVAAYVRRRPVQSTIRVPLFAACTLNATGQYRVTISLR